ncbi:TRAP transporter permease [Salicibibacter halophilus]|nr:TRAP transporter fused permease subunit [Salicibibacter halophilus]
MERLGKFWSTIVIILVLIAIFLSVNQIFYLGLFGITPIFEGYLYFLLACFIPLAFIIWPAKKSAGVQKIKWYDVILFLIPLVFFTYLGLNAETVTLMGWGTSAPTLPTIGSILVWFIVLEALRRVAGLVLMLISLVFSLFPLVTGYMPVNFLRGIPQDFVTTATNHIMSGNSILGVPMRTLGDLLVGFLIFGVVLVHTKGGDFFFNLAKSLFGRQRGGPAKVSVMGSAFFGMLSGSAVSNVVTTGSMTIPAMKRIGYSKHKAAAIEAASSTGGTTTPPIMGSAAFIMASFLAVPYGEIALAAAIPALLYFVGVLTQVDAYAAKHKIAGTPSDEEIPSFWQTLKTGWFFVGALILLIYLIVIVANEGHAPYYVSLFLILASFISKETRLTLKKTKDMILNAGKLIAEITTILAGVGFIVGSLSVTGVSFSFSRELVALAGDSALLILLAGAITSFILGLGMTVSAAYIFLAVVMAPALVQMGFDPIASHLFVLYWATVSYITPPVALSAYAASSIANASPIKTGFSAMQLGVVKYIMPFFFIYNTALIGRAEPVEVVVASLFALMGTWMIASAFEGYLIGLGELSVFLRIIVFVAGFLLFFPELLTSLSGLILTVIVYLGTTVKNRVTDVNA